MQGWMVVIIEFPKVRFKDWVVAGWWNYDDLTIYRWGVTDPELLTGV